MTVLRTRLAALLQRAAHWIAGRHVYLSTGCLHGDQAEPDGRTGHEYCQTEAQRYDGSTKVAGTCKFCAAPCVCRCHSSRDLEKGQSEFKEAVGDLNADAYDQRIRARPSETAAAALRERLESGDVARRRVGTDRLAESGVGTPGCDCGHDGMGEGWRASSCEWRSTPPCDQCGVRGHSFEGCPEGS